MYKRKFKKIVAIILVFGLVFSLTVPVDARRNKDRKKGRRINNIVNIIMTLREVRRLTRPPAASTDCKFEKGDVILRRMGLNEIRAWTSAIGFLVSPGLSVMSWRFFSQLSLAGHSGLYMEWEPDEKSDPAIKKNHKIIESQARRGPGYDNFENFIKIKHFWGVGTSDRLTDEDRRKLIKRAESQISEDIGFDFFSDYKSPGKSFRCDGLVEWAYETVGIDIIPNDWWCAKKGHNLLCARKQLDALDAQNKALFPTLTFGKEDDEGEEIYGPIEIGGKEVEPDEDDKYKVHGDEVKVKIYASDIDWNGDGSGITRVQLWVGEPDDTPEEMPGFRIMGDDDEEDYPGWHDYVYTWDTTKKDDQGEPLFPNGDYTLKAIAFDQAGNTKETYIDVKIEELSHYFHVQLSPEYVETGSPVSQTQTFTIKVQCYNYGTSETKPDVEGERYVDKKEGTESWWRYVNDELDIDEWRKEKINPGCVASEQWEKSDYNEEISFGIANITNSTYELYTGGEKLGTLELVDGAGTMSGVVIKAKDGDIGDNHLFLIISASDGTGNGNGALMVNPIIVNYTQIFNYFTKSSDYQVSNAHDDPDDWGLVEYDHRWNACLHGHCGFPLDAPRPECNEGYWYEGWIDRTWYPGETYYLGFRARYYRRRNPYHGGFHRFVQVWANKGEVSYNLTEQAIGYAPNEIEKAWMVARVHPSYPTSSLVKYTGSLKNTTTGEIGQFVEAAPHDVYILWQSIPVSDFGSSTRTYAIEPSLETEGVSGAQQLKPGYDPDYPPNAQSGILTDYPKIYFIPKTEE